MSSRRFANVCIAGMVLCAFFCGGLFVVLDRPQERFRHEFDLGDGLKLTVISSRRSELDRPFDPNPLYLDYRVDAGRRQVVPVTMLAHDFGDDYDFRLVQTADRRLAAVYEATDRRLVVLFDSDSGESWPRLRDDESPSKPGVIDKWQERYRRLVAEHPVVPEPW